MAKIDKKKYRVNERIRVPKVRLIDADGKQVGIVSREEALRLAEEQGLDLVEIAPQADPPVCRIMDYGQFLYQQAKKAKEAKKKQAVVEVKEIKVRPKTDTHDLETKIRHIKRFLKDKNKVKIRVFFRGREITKPELGMEVLKKILEAVENEAQVEMRPRMEGRQMIMILGPKKN
ncbi:translation initiation factor IF-3 [Thermodesulfatator indicus DSM 15286]|uniref:Translation initiation factor IF-3 n=1 Tax=Thermodesulfatator indicus (strain DSM 15286 / JCM 11887 / CIR29812) TaxID=667014 RepID=F8AAU2_THEID|nr:translation initiation factor IF-3 [Thermodesulfatator indicus]AEH45453.1 translation initiation factor IF-3 [Thermodesulfatator indicus DSM 15286]